MPRAIGWKDIPALNRIRKHIRAAGPFDIIHGHSSKGGGYARLLKLCENAPIVYTPHAFVTLSPVAAAPKRLLYGMIEAALALMTDRIICVSSAEREHARRLGIADGKLAVIGNGAAAISGPSRESVRERLGIDPGRVVVGFVGRMDDQKAPERLVAAARQLLPQLSQLLFLMIGDGPKRQPLEAGLRKTGLGDQVRWLGAVDARDYMPGFDILALPSLYEGFPYVLVEALHAGLPIVSTPVGGTHETVAAGVNGIIVPHGDTEKMAEAIRLLATDRALRCAMAKASLERAELFSIPRMIDAMEDLYIRVAEAEAAKR